MILSSSPLRVVFTDVDVTVIALIRLRLPLEGNPFVGGRGMEDEPEEPFKAVDDVEPDIGKFLHLRGVDGFVIEDSRLRPLVFLVPPSLADEDHPEQVDGNVAGKRDYVALDDLHRISMVIFSPLL